MKKYIVLLSGGIDSVVNLFEASQNGTVLRALTFDYGQRAKNQEVKAARYFCEKLKVRHEVIELPWLSQLTRTALVDVTQNLPKLRDLDDMSEASKSASAVWVPNRNGVFLNIGAAFAESLGAQFIVPGFNREEAATFPDNSNEFLEATNQAFSLSTLEKVQTFCFTTHLDKKDIFKRARELGIDLDRVWSCYRGGETPCGECESCQRTLRGQARR